MCDCTHTQVGAHVSLHVHLCVHACAHSRAVTSGCAGDRGAAKKSEMSSSEVCYRFDVGRPLLSADRKHSQTSPFFYLPLTISLTLILLRLGSNSCPLYFCTWLACARVRRGTKCRIFHSLATTFPVCVRVLPNGLHELCKPLQDLFN